MTKVRSSDGTAIAFGQVGDGPPIIMVGGATEYRSINPTAKELVALLAPQFAVITAARAATRRRTPSSARWKTSRR